MFEAIREIGGIRLGEKIDSKGTEILESLLEDAPKPPQFIKEKKVPQGLHIVILDYNTFDPKIEVDFEEIKGDETSRTYIWLRNLSGNTDQIYSTTKNLEYLLSQTIPNLKERLPKESNLSERISRAIDSLFYDLDFQKRNRYVLDIERLKKKLGLDEVDVKQFSKLTKEMENLNKMMKGDVSKEKKKEIYGKLSEVSKKVCKEVSLKIDEFISRKTLLKKKDIGLYTLKIDGRLIAEDEDYKKVVLKEKIDSLFGEKKGVCSSCNKYEAITDRPKFSRANSALGYYITDKVGFSSELSDDFKKSLILCKDCYKNLLSGEVFVRNKLATNIGGLSLYIIPKFFFLARPRKNQLDKWAEFVTDSFNSVKSLKGLREFEEKLERYSDLKNAKNNFFLNLLFFKKARTSEFKILKLIKDVPPTRLEILKRVTNKVNDIGERLLGADGRWEIGLQGMYYLIPMRKRKGDIIEYRKLLELYDALFSERLVSCRFLIQQFVALAQVYRFKKFDFYNIGELNDSDKDSDRELIHAVLKANLFLLYLKKLRLLKGGEGNMDYDGLDVNEDTKNFAREMGYDEPKMAMFLLGCLIGEIGNAQYRDGNSKPILGKITYQGMNKNKLIRLLNDVFEKLTQYKSKRKALLHYNEGVFAECKRLMDKGMDTPFSDQENVFYVLSGYAYATYQAIIGATPKKEIKKEQEVNANVQ